MWLLVVLMEDMPIVKEQRLYKDKFYADREAKSLEAQGEDVCVIEMKVEDEFFCKPATDEMKKLVWGEEYV